MSRIGKYPVSIPNNVTISQEGRTITVEGPKGTLQTEIGESFQVDIQENEIWVIPGVENMTQELKAYWGLYRSLVANLVHGVTMGYAKYLRVEGVGYRVRVDGENTLVLNLGYSHEVTVQAPEGVDFAVENNQITVSGIDKQLVGQIAADIRAKRPPEPYKGKGIRYTDETVRIKEGKTAS